MTMDESEANNTPPDDMPKMDSDRLYDDEETKLESDRSSDSPDCDPAVLAGASTTTPDRKTKNISPDDMQKLYNDGMDEDVGTILDGDRASDSSDYDATVLETPESAFPRSSDNGAGIELPKPESDSSDMPSKIGKFRITGLLGQGGMGCVYKAWHPDLDIPVAIKTIKPGNVSDLQFIDRLIREARLATKLSHPNVVRVYDVDHDNNVYYIVQEFVDGQDLYELIRSAPNGTIELSKALEIIVGITGALVEAEKHNVIHRDIKPSNILVSTEGIPKLADMGLAKQAQPVESDQANIHLTNSGASMGSPAYMAPEQVTDAKSVDIRADIYALGVTFYHMATGVLPFAGRSTQEVMMKALHETAIGAASINPELPGSVAVIIDKMMEKDVEKRYQSPTAVLQDLEEITRPRAKSKLLLAAVYVLAITLIAALSLLFLKPQKSVTSYSEIERELAGGNFDGALALLVEQLDKNRNNEDLLYALGLCYLQKNQQSELASTVSALDALPNGQEMARHLQTMTHLYNNDFDSALRLIQEALPSAQHKLPFLQSRGIALQRQGKITEAKESFNSALQEASFFTFQKLSVVDHLARLFVNEGKVDQAKNLYTQAIDKDPEASITPDIGTNYAVTLMKAGDTQTASDFVDKMLSLNPKDEMTLYLKKQLSENSAEAQASKIQATMEMIDDVNQNIGQRSDRVDRWTSSPLILTFLKLENRSTQAGRLGVEDLWIDHMIDIVRAHNNFPIVDRESLDHILRELKLNASDLGSTEAQLKIGSLLPASILVKGSFVDAGLNLMMNLQLVDVQTSEIIGIAKNQVDNGDRQELIAGISVKLNQLLRSNFRVSAKITAGDDGVFEINVGKYHGLQEGKALNIYPPQDRPSARLLARKKPVAKAKVVDLDKFAAVVEITENTAPIVPDMLVLVAE